MYKNPDSSLAPVSSSLPEESIVLYLPVKWLLWLFPTSVFQNELTETV